MDRQFFFGQDLPQPKDRSDVHKGCLAILGTVEEQLKAILEEEQTITPVFSDIETQTETTVADMTRVDDFFKKCMI